MTQLGAPPWYLPTRANPNHVPKGPKGGQFAPKVGGGSTRPVGEYFDGFTHGGLTAVVRRDETFSDGVRQVRGEIRDAKGKRCGAFRRTFIDGAVVHNELKLNKSKRGSGFGTAFVRDSIKKYREDGGLNHVEIEAGDDLGGYVWAREGFQFSDGNAAQQKLMINKAIEGAGESHMWETVECSPALKAKFAAKMAAGEFEGPAEIAAYGREETWTAGGRTTWIGKHFLVGNHWSGRLDL